MTHICVSKLSIIGSDNGLSPGRRQAIIWTNDRILLIRTLWTNFSEILSEIHAFSFKKMHLKMSSAKWRPFCIGLNVLIHYGLMTGYGTANLCNWILVQVMTSSNPLLGPMVTYCYFDIWERALGKFVPEGNALQNYVYKILGILFWANSCHVKIILPTTIRVANIKTSPKHCWHGTVGECQGCPNVMQGS